MQPADIRKAPMDEKFVTLTERQIRGLYRYDHTDPSGCYPGKCWLHKFPDRPDALFLLWFGLSPKGPDYCSTYQREVVIATAPTQGENNER